VAAFDFDGTLTRRDTLVPFLRRACGHWAIVRARLQAWLDARFGPGADVELWAYGDSPGDAELLAMADHPTWVGRRALPAGPA
jgi:phosphoserine phosphatase